MDDFSLRNTGRTTRLIESLPAYPTEKLYFVAANQQIASNLRPLIRQVKGPNYPHEMIEARGASGISKWAGGIWHDRFYFDHTVWDYFSDLPQDDQDFLMMLTTDIQIGEFFQIGKHDPVNKKAEGWFGKLKKKVSSWFTS